MLQTNNYASTPAENTDTYFSLRVTHTGHRRLWKSLIRTHRLLLISNFISAKTTFYILSSKLGCVLFVSSELEAAESHGFYSLCVMATTCYSMSCTSWIARLCNALSPALTYGKCLL